MKKNRIEKLMEILNQHKSLLKSIDNKSSILLAICSILIVAITTFISYLKWYFVFANLFIFFIVLILLIISIFPRDKPLKGTKSNDILYFGSINKHCKNKKNDKSDSNNYEIDFFLKEISKNSIIEQMIRICQIISVKYLFQKISIIVLSLNIFLFVIFMLIGFL